jgi:hypothetical protein
MKSLNLKNNLLFSKSKEAFTVKLKMISVDHYFRPHQTLKTPKHLKKKIFYTKTNKTLVKRLIFSNCNIAKHGHVWSLKFHNNKVTESFGSKETTQQCQYISRPLNRKIK